MRTSWVAAGLLALALAAAPASVAAKRPQLRLSRSGTAVSARLLGARPAGGLVLAVDGRVRARDRRPPFAVRVVLAPGKHRLVARGGRGGRVLARAGVRVPAPARRLQASA